MNLIAKSTFDASMSSYQRGLMRAMLPAVAIYVAVMGGLFLSYVEFGDQVPPPYKTWVGLALILAAFLSTQVVMIYFRRNVRRLSIERGLICPSCSAALGSNYATLKRTGKCRACGEQVVGAV
jgi:hypothetical protein